MSSPIPELTDLQYRKVLRYWRIIEEIEYTFTHNPNYESHYDLETKLAYWEQEYKSYIERIGFQFNDRQMSEPLYQLINQGIII
jgi:uncharacterized protein YhjY with autotransporter beta-barrel domain